MAKYESYQKSVLEASVWLSEEGFFGSHKGTGGNVSVRADEAALAITPSSVKYQEIKVSDICVVGFDLSVIEEMINSNPLSKRACTASFTRRGPMSML